MNEDKEPGNLREHDEEEGPVPGAIYCKWWDVLPAYLVWAVGLKHLWTQLAAMVLFDVSTDTVAAIVPALHFVAFFALMHFYRVWVLKRKAIREKGNRPA
jgi:hypothetical protein